MKSTKGKILFVEDERHIVDLYHNYFETNGYDFISTADIKDALMITESKQPDAVLLDIILPKEENGKINLIAEQGYDYLAAAKINFKTKNVPIIVFTNLDAVKDRKKCEDMGAAAYIFKRDTTPHEVLEAVAQVIKKHKQCRN